MVERTKYIENETTLKFMANIKLQSIVRCNLLYLTIFLLLQNNINIIYVLNTNQIEVNLRSLITWLVVLVIKWLW